MTYSTLGVLSFSVSVVIEIESCDDEENLTLCLGSSYPGNHRYYPHSTQTSLGFYKIHSSRIHQDPLPAFVTAHREAA
jgi:hypothetical protein